MRHSEHPQFGMPRATIAGSIRISHQASCCCCSATAGIAIGANFKIYLFRQFCSNRVQFFYNTQETQTHKNDGPEFWNSNSVIFENFLKFSKRRRAVPLQPIWTIMVVAKLDHSRVLVTKFRQNRSTVKRRSAGQTHTHTQTDRQTQLKIRALQVCNWAKNVLMAAYLCIWHSNESCQYCHMKHQTQLFNGVITDMQIIQYKAK